MDYLFNPSSLTDVPELVQAYLASLSSPIDSFLEQHILDSELYVIESNAGAAGYFALHENKGLTQFYLRENFLKDGQQIFSDILRRFSVKSAFVPTCDELFLSHALDQETTIDKQAYFFQDNKAIDVSHKLYPGGHFRRANPDDTAEIEQICGNFFDRLAERIANREIFILTEDDVLLGAGIIEQGRLLQAYANIGMFTHEPFRQRGIGRSLIIYLKRWCYERGQNPIAGCWYYNLNSKRTLESAGMITKTRLLNIHFRES